MAKTGFEKFAEKNNAMSELNIEIKRGGNGAEKERASSGGTRAAGARKDAGKPRTVKKLFNLPADLVEALEVLKERTYKPTLAAVVVDALSEYVRKNGGA